MFPESDGIMSKCDLSAERRSALEKLCQPFAIYQFIDKRVVTLLLSDGFLKLFGYKDREEAVYDMNNNMYKDTHPDDVARIADAAYRFATEGGKYEVLYRSKDHDNEGYRIIHAFGEHTYDDSGNRFAEIWYTDEGTYVKDDVLEYKQLNSALTNELQQIKIAQNNQYDILTGLPNMNYFFDLANERKTSIRDQGGRPMMVYFDLKGMKFFNTKFSFFHGDEMLQQFAYLLKQSFGELNCCRIGSDHFALICEEEGMEEKLDRLFEEWQKISSELPVHAGIYRSRDEAIHISIALDRAKLACTALKDNYSSCYMYYSQVLSDEENHKQYVIENIDKAIENGWIQVFIQPIVRAVSGKVCDVEALARWIDPDRGMLSPAEFIPALEEAGLIYKLDLHMIDLVLEAMKRQSSEDLLVVPHSINLSRSDFDACDIVKEITRRVDAAGVRRELITIEITESIIGRDFEFMKEQIERFRSLGFPVWMDDFGSGYSSLDVLQSIRFDLIKFDMSFMARLDESDAGKIVLTEMLRMTNALGLDSICEGVETKEQVDFLKEIGCSKLQGFYFSKPLPFDDVSRMHKDNTMIRAENPEESAYYESIGRVNLFDLGVVGSVDEKSLHGTFNNIPIAILEVNGNDVRSIRSNRSYQEFARRFLDLDIFKWKGDLSKPSDKYDPTFMQSLKKCRDNGTPLFFDEKMADDSLIHSFVRLIDVNPRTGACAIVAAILSVSEPRDVTTFADIAGALASDYYNIYVIDLDTNEYIEYSLKSGNEEMSLKRHGGDFFESARRDTLTRIYIDDQQHFLDLFTKENVLKEIEIQGVFTTTYRLVDTGSPVYVNMKITKMANRNRLILGVSIIDAHMKQLEEERKLRQERISLGRIAALSPDYIVLYLIDPKTDHYTQYNPSKEFATLDLATQGDDFFKDVVLDAPKAIAREDMENHLRIMSKENVLAQIEKNGYLIYSYRLHLEGRYVPATLKATMVEENDGKKIILGVTLDKEQEDSDPS